jgi:hypothetical protein
MGRMRNFIIIFSISLITFISCNFRNYDNIYISKNINKSIHNIEVLQKWLYWDYQNNKIPEYVLNEYNTVLENTKLSLIKNERKLEKYIAKD